MEGRQNWDEHQSTSSNSCHTMGTFDSAATHGLFTVRSEHVSLSKGCKDPSIGRVRASENWQLLRNKLGSMKASPSKEDPSSQAAIGEMVLETNSALETALLELRDSSSKDRAATHWRRFCNEISKRQHGVIGREADEGAEKPSFPLRCEPSSKESKDIANTNHGSMSSKVISALQLESFSLPPKQSCVVRGEPPKFAQSLLKDKYSDLCCSSKLEGQNKIPGLGQVSNSGLACVDSSPTTSSSSAEETRQNASQIKRHPTTSKLSTGTDEVTAKAAKGKKSPSISSRSSGPNFPNFRQRQQELHRYRVLIEQRRLDLLELRIAREREEAKQYMILFQKKMQI